MSITDVSPIIYPVMSGDSGGTVTLDAADEFLVSVIRIPKTGTLTKIGWRSGWSISGSSYTLKISLETVAETVGQPVATTNAGKTLYVTGAESADITSISANTLYYTAINGTTGIDVTAGDLVAVTFRLTAVSASSIMIRTGGVTDGSTLNCSSQNIFYYATYLGSTWNYNYYSPLITLEYSDGFCPLPYSNVLCVSNAQTYNSGSSYPYTGMKIRYPFKCRLSGLHMYLDLDGDVDVIIYGSDEYTVMTGFPITLKNTQRGSTSARFIQVLFPTKPTFEANTYYRIIVLPKSTTDVVLSNYTAASDGSYNGYDLFPEGDDVCLTQRATEPTSGSHTWIDTALDKPRMHVLIDGIETSTGAAGGISRSRQLMG